MEKNAKIIVQDLEKKNSDMKKIKLLFFDLENNISLCFKSMNEKDLDLDRKDVFDRFNLGYFHISLIDRVNQRRFKTLFIERRNFENKNHIGKRKRNL